MEVPKLRRSVAAKVMPTPVAIPSVAVATLSVLLVPVMYPRCPLNDQLLHSEYEPSILREQTHRIIASVIVVVRLQRAHRDTVAKAISRAARAQYQAV